MKSNRLFLFASAILLIVTSSCHKPNPPAPTVFTLHCIDAQGNDVPGTTVSLFNNYNDYYDLVNAVGTGTTDNQGFISFSGVNSQNYYFDCINSANCLINWNAQVTGSPILANQENRITVVLTGYGYISVTNTSPGHNPYMLKLNGQVWYNSLDFGHTATSMMPLGNCTVEAIQLSGYVNNPTDVTYVLNVTSCQTTSQDIP